MNKVVKVILITFSILILIIISIILFVLLYKPFGYIPIFKDTEDYSKRAVNFKDGMFHNEEEVSLYTSWVDPYKNRTSGKGVVPIDKLPYKKYKYSELENLNDVKVTWFGHSSILLQMHNMNILIDPVFSNVTSPVSFIGPKRYSENTVNIEDLPHIDAVVITHDHYDHTDYKTLKSLENITDKFIVPLGIDKDLIKFGINENKITNMAWWEEVKINGLTIASTPAIHYSGRVIIDKNKTLWSSWIFKDEYHIIYESGDTGYGKYFKEIKEKYGDIDFAMFDCAQYSVNWHNIHMFPEEAVEASIDMNASISMPIHYGAFNLSNHSWDDPVSRFTMYAKEKNVNYVTPLLGETFSIEEYKNYQTRWWEDIK